MQEKDHLYHVKKCKEQLEILLSTSNLKDDPFIIELFTRLSIIENDINELRNGHNKSDSHIRFKLFLENEIKNIFTDFISSSSFKNVNLIVDNFLNVQELLKILEVLPLYLKIAQFFKFDNCPLLYIKNSCLEFIGKLSSAQNLETSKTELYSCMRKLLREHTLVTFELDEASNEIKLYCRIDDQDSKYFVSCSDSDEITLVLPSIISHYEASEVPKHPHLCLEITDKYSLLKHKAVPEYLFETIESYKKVIFYFPFIFRPLSLIIPLRGNNLPLNHYSSVDNTGCVGNDTVSPHKHMVNIDLFFHFDRS